MDFSMLYRVVWKPSEVFKEIKGKSRIEPFIFVAVIVLYQGLKPYVGHFGEIGNSPFAFVMNLLVGFFFFLAFPLVDTIVTALTAAVLRLDKQATFTLLSAFILCALPYYVETILVLTFGYTPIGLGALLPSLETVSPFAFGVVATITPFFVCTIALWWFAVQQLYSLSETRKNIFIVFCLALINMILGGLIWRMTSLVAK